MTVPTRHAARTTLDEWSIDHGWRHHSPGVLAPIDPTLPVAGNLTAAEIHATMAYAEAEKAEAMREAYAAD